MQCSALASLVVLALAQCACASSPGVPTLAATLAALATTGQIPMGDFASSRSLAVDDCSRRSEQLGVRIGAASLGTRARFHVWLSDL